MAIVAKAHFPAGFFYVQLQNFQGSAVNFIPLSEMLIFPLFASCGFVLKEIYGFYAINEAVFAVIWQRQ